MDSDKELGAFLKTRRAKITPEQAGMGAYGGTRRVPGLRREELAVLANISVEYLTRLERGNASGVSDAILNALGDALQLDEAETEHLFALAKNVRGSARPPQRRPPAQVRPIVQRLLDAMDDVPAFVRNGRLDVLAINPLGRALYAPLYATATDMGQSPNLARFCLMDPQAHNLYPDWDTAVNITVALLRTEAGRDPHDKALTGLIGELVTRSDVFRSRWAAHNVRLHRGGLKHFRHPVVGELALPFEAMELPADPGLTLTAYSPEPGSDADEKLRLLASWAASVQQTTSASGRD
jgi:transcriptional regulator with XRE-family HTH domain